MSRVFISHAAADAGLARLLAEALAESSPPRQAFLASRPGDIRADAEWLPAIQAAIVQASDFLILLTPASVSRPWVAFEAGAAWFANRPLVLARVAALAPEEIPLPVGARQAYRIDQEDELAVVLHALGTTHPSIRELVSRLRGAPGAHGAVVENAWEGIVYDGTYFAWAGPLLSLEDRAEIVPPAGLAEALRERGLSVRMGRLDRLAVHITRGRAQLYATDRRTWRRPVADAGQIMLVGSQHDRNIDGAA